MCSPRVNAKHHLLGRRRRHFRSPRLYTRLGAESIAIIHRRRGMLLQLSTIWLEGHRRAVPAYQRKSSSSRPPTMTLSITVPPHTSWCRINCDHSSTARNAPPTFHDMARGSLSCGPRVSAQIIIFWVADDDTFDHHASAHIIVRNQLRSFIDGSECSSNFPRYGSMVIAGRSPRVARNRHHLGHQ